MLTTTILLYFYCQRHFNSTCHIKHCKEKSDKERVTKQNENPKITFKFETLSFLAQLSQQQRCLYDRYGVNLTLLQSAVVRRHR